MSEPTAALQAVRASTADLLAGLADEHWSDADLRAASLCDGWTRGHVLTHLARNADGIAATLAGALRGEIVPRYPDGDRGRDADIEAGSSRSVAAVLSDLTESAERLDRVFGAVSDADCWDAATDHRTAGEWPARRVCELELHRVDLLGDYHPDRWPPFLVSDLLPAVVTTVEQRSAVALRLTVAEAGSIVPALAGREWTIGSREPIVRVHGPDWALLAWLTGRTRFARDVLGDLPELTPWR